MEKMLFSAEENLKIASLRTSASLPAHDALIRALLSGNPDWQVFLKGLVTDGVSQIVYWNLKKTNLSGLFPQDTFRELKDRYLNSLGHNLTLGRIMGEILRDLEGADPIILKGAALAAAAYEDIGLRGFSDVDILIRQEDVGKVDDILINKWGFNMFSSSLFCREYVSQGKPYGVDYPVVIDLSWEIVPAERFANILKWDTESVRRNSKKSEIFGREARILSAEDSLIFSVYHMVFHHNFSGILWFVDMQQIVRKWKNSIEWDRVIGDACEYRIGAVTYRAFSYAVDLLGAEVPLSVMERFRARVRRASLDRLSAYKAGPNGLARGGSAARIFYPLILDTRMSMLRMLLALIFPSRRWLRFRFGNNKDNRVVKNAKIKRHNHPLAQWIEYIKCLIEGYL